MTGKDDEWTAGDLSNADRATLEREAAVFRRLRAHLLARSDVQNIDMMTLAGFCRNCLANWYADAAGAQGTTLSKDEARAIFYGEPYEAWRARNQREASAGQMAAFDTAAKNHR
jgi:uncharacterized protein